MRRSKLHIPAPHAAAVIRVRRIGIHPTSAAREERAALVAELRRTYSLRDLGELVGISASTLCRM